MADQNIAHSFHVVIDKEGKANVKFEGLPQKIAEGLVEAGRNDKAIAIMIRYAASELIKNS